MMHHLDGTELNNREQSKLFVDYSHVVWTPVENRPSRFYPDATEGYHAEAWRVGVEDEGYQFYFLTAFGRKKDAEAAKSALEREGLINASAIMSAGRATMERIMAEAMQW